MKAPTPLTDRVNTAPAIINGMTGTEANLIAAVSFALSLFVGGVIYLVTRFWPLLVIVCIGGPLLALWYGSLYLQKVKRDRPDGFYVQAIHIYLSGLGIFRCHFNRHHRFYEIGAGIDMSFNPPLEMGADSQATDTPQP